jgi:hypothetical protein
MLNVPDKLCYGHDPAACHFSGHPAILADTGINITGDGFVIPQKRLNMVKAGDR